MKHALAVIVALAVGSPAAWAATDTAAGLWHTIDDAYTGGELLDPHNGKTYSAKMTLLDGGEKLAVHGFIGFSLIGRSQTWVREE